MKKRPRTLVQPGIANSLKKNHHIVLRYILSHRDIKFISHHIGFQRIS